MPNELSSRAAEAEPRARLLARACVCLAVIGCGLALRRYGLGLGLAAFIVKYGGSLLWGVMVFFLLSMFAPSLSPRAVATVALAVAVSVELFRLVHTPWLDAFRLTTTGALLLGRIFSPWNIVAYGIGIYLGLQLDRLVLSRC